MPGGPPGFLRAGSPAEGGKEANYTLNHADNMQPGSFKSRAWVNASVS